MNSFFPGYQFILKNRHLICICSPDIHNLYTDVCFKVKKTRRNNQVMIHRRKPGEDDTQVMKTQLLAVYSNAQVYPCSSMNRLFPKNILHFEDEAQGFLPALWLTHFPLSWSLLLIGHRRDGQQLCYHMQHELKSGN